MTHPTFALTAATALATLLAVILRCVWFDARTYRHDRRERAAGVRYVWDGTRLQRTEIVAAPVLVTR